jgi:putative DNA primase/helicase
MDSTNINATTQEELFKASLARAAELDQSYRKQPQKEQLPKGFYFFEDNLMFQPEAREGQEDIPMPIYISSALKVTACTRDKENENHGRLLDFKDLDGMSHNWAMPMELLAGDGTEYRKELLSKGLIIAPGSKPRQLLTTYIQQS